MAQRHISPERKVLYYSGMVIAILGFLSFGSVFVSSAVHFGDFSNFAGRTHSMAMRAIVGMGMMIVGGIMMTVGSRGAAGAGLILNPDQARRDVEPWTRMTGGMVKDALDEADIKLGSASSGEPLPFDERLRRLEKLRQEGLISETEFQQTKQKILSEA